MAAFTFAWSTASAAAASTPTASNADAQRNAVMTGPRRRSGLADDHLDRYKVVDHVAAAVRVPLLRLRGPGRVGRPGDQLGRPAGGRRPGELPRPPAERLFVPR